MTNHGCGISWCTNERANSKAHLLEHTSDAWYGSATGNAIARPGNAYGEMILSVGVGLRFNADVDPAPILYLHLTGGCHHLDLDAEFQLSEAILLHHAMSEYLQAALADSQLDPAAVKEYFHEVESQ